MRGVHLRIQSEGLGCRSQQGVRAQGWGFWVRGLGLGDWSLGFRVWGFGFGVQGLGFTNSFRRVCFSIIIL